MARRKKGVSCPKRPCSAGRARFGRRAKLLHFHGRR